MRVGRKIIVDIYSTVGLSPGGARKRLSRAPASSETPAEKKPDKTKTVDDDSIARVEEHGLLGLGARNVSVRFTVF